MNRLLDTVKFTVWPDVCMAQIIFEMYIILWLHPADLECPFVVSTWCVD